MATLDIANSKNKKIVVEFEKLIEQIKFDIDHNPIQANYYRLQQNKKVLGILKKFPDEITTSDQLKNTPGVGDKSRKRIDEILKTGHLSEIKGSAKHKKYIQYMDNLEEVYGIGRKTAYILVTKYNITSVEQLKVANKAKIIKLPHKIVVGLKYYKIYEENIPRSEMDMINNFIKQQVSNIDKDLIYQICGSYRRLRPSSNDIDILLVHPDIKTKEQQKKGKTNYLIELVKELKKIKFLLDDLTDKNYEVDYMGFCKLNNNPVRRIDIRFFPYDSYYSALMHFTGSGDFNKKLRLIAQNLGYKLSEYGLLDIKTNKYVKIKSEKDIFIKLGLEYIPPERR